MVGMRILVDGRCFQTLYATGVSAYASSVLHELFLNNKDNEYVVWYNGVKKSNVPLWNYPNVLVVQTRWPNKILHACLTIFSRPYIDLLVAKKCGGSFDQILSINLHAIVFSKKVQHILTVHDLSFEHLPECYTIWQRIRQALLKPKKQCRRAHEIRVPSLYTKNDLICTYGIDEKRIKVVPPRVVQMVEDVGSLECPDKFVLFVGTVEPRKNIETMLDAFEKSCLYRNSGVSLVIVGSRGWKSKKVFDRASKTPGVIYLGYVDDKQKWALYRRAMVCLYPSLYEGYGLPVAEAVSVGTPVITSNRTSLLELCDNNLITYINPDNVVELTRALQHYST